MNEVNGTMSMGKMLLTCGLILGLFGILAQGYTNSNLIGNAVSTTFEDNEIRGTVSFLFNMDYANLETTYGGCCSTKMANLNNGKFFCGFGIN